MNSLPPKTLMERPANTEDEVRLLRALCEEDTSGATRLEILHSLEGHVFVDPEHQVVFESIRFLLPRGGVSEARLAVHLNNRGFPDVGLEKYFSGVTMNDSRREIRDKGKT
jgi:hypothetical protein